MAALLCNSCFLDVTFTKEDCSGIVLCIIGGWVGGSLSFCADTFCFLHHVPPINIRDTGNFFVTALSITVSMLAHHTDEAIVTLTLQSHAVTR